ncbi:MAG: HD-like signal output (HDOD) protein [Alphaproteobacteria bacterium]
MFVLFVALAIVIIIWLRSGNSSNVATNSLIKHRQKRVSSQPSHTNLPDASSAHAHEKKLKVEDAPVISPRFFEFRLITSISDAHQYHVLTGDQNMRKPHPLLSALTGNVSDAKTLYETVKTDPELVAKIINVSNSPLFGLSKPITNVHHAIVYLGIVQVKNIATHFALQKSLDFSDKQQQKAYQQIWSASFLAGSIMLVMAKAMQLDNAAELSTRCQLGYLGDISTLFSSPETAKLYVENTSYLERIDFIQQLTEANTAILGGVLAKKWNLPKDISDSLHNSALPFTNQFSDTKLSDLQIQQILVCYCCCRLAEAILFDNSNDILNANAFSFEETGKEEFYYIPELLEQYHLTRLSSALADTSTKSKLIEAVNLTIQKLH